MIINSPAVGLTADSGRWIRANRLRIGDESWLIIGKRDILVSNVIA